MEVCAFICCHTFINFYCCMRQQTQSGNNYSKSGKSEEHISTVEINKIISDIKTYINKTINIADATIAQSEKGILVVSDAKNAFNMINNNTRDIIEKVNDLVVVTERVVSSSKLFTKSFYQTMEVAESTSASIEEIAASLETQTETMDKITNSSSRLAQSAKDMHELVGKFKIN
mgnify:FL=1